VRVPDRATSYVAIGEWPLRRAEPCWIVSVGAAQPGCCRARRRCVAACRGTDPAALDAAVVGWAVGRLTAEQALAAGAYLDLVPADSGRRVIAIDGKALRGSAPRATPEPVAAAAQGGGRTHLVAAFDHASGVTLGPVPCSPGAGTGGQVATANELAAALDARGLLTESVITVDAGLTARELAADLRSAGALDPAAQGQPEDAAHPAGRRCPGPRCPRPLGSARSATAGSRPAPSGSST